MGQGGPRRPLPSCQRRKPHESSRNRKCVLFYFFCLFVEVHFLSLSLLREGRAACSFFFGRARPLSLSFLSPPSLLCNKTLSLLKVRVFVLRLFLRLGLRLVVVVRGHRGLDSRAARGGRGAAWGGAGLAARRVRGARDGRRWVLLVAPVVPTALARPQPLSSSGCRCGRGQPSK